MLNRYHGNTGKVEQIDDSYTPHKAPQTVRPLPEQHERSMQVRREQGLLEGIGRLLHGSAEGLDSEDIILLLILYLMYRESGDTELLIIMGAMFLM